MDVQLQELIDKIKKDGVATAETAAAAIVSDAEKKAAAIIAEAEEKAAEIVSNAKAETARMEKASIDAIGQAGRNLLISFRDGVVAELDSLIKTEVTKAYDEALLKKLIPETVKAWAANVSTDDLAVLVPEKSLSELESAFKSSLKSEIDKGLVVKADTSMQSGFRIGTKDGSAFYDFSSEAVADLYAAYLNPVVANILKEAAK